MRCRSEKDGNAHSHSHISGKMKAGCADFKRFPAIQRGIFDSSIKHKADRKFQPQECAAYFED
jgi:hypothetical protein